MHEMIRQTAEPILDEYAQEKGLIETSRIEYYSGKEGKQALGTDKPQLLLWNLSDNPAPKELGGGASLDLTGSIHLNAEDQEILEEYLAKAARKERSHNGHNSNEVDTHDKTEDRHP